MGPMEKNRMSDKAYDKMIDSMTGDNQKSTPRQQQHERAIAMQADKEMAAAVDSGPTQHERAVSKQADKEMEQGIAADAKADEKPESSTEYLARTKKDSATESQFNVAEQRARDRSAPDQGGGQMSYDSLRLAQLEARYERLVIEVAQIKANLITQQPAQQPGIAGSPCTIWTIPAVVITSGGSVTGQTVSLLQGGSKIAITTNGTVYNTAGVATSATLGNIYVGANGDGTFLAIAQACA